MNKLFTSLLFVFAFATNHLFSQLNIKVKVESIAVQNMLDCDGFAQGDSDFLFEFKATDNSVALLSNNTPTIGSIGNCNFVSIAATNGPYSLTPTVPGGAMFSPSNGIFYDHSYNCYQNIPTALTIVWRGYENDDATTPSTGPIASGTTAINTMTLAIPSNVTSTVLTVQYTATSPDVVCDQTYIIKFSVSISTGTFYPMFIEHTHENVICPGGTNGTAEVHPVGGSGTVLVDWSNDGVGDFNDPQLLSGLSAGSYTVIIKDALNCTDTAVAVITTTPSPVAISGFLQSKSNVCMGSTITYEVPTQTNTSNFLWLYSGTGAVFSSTSASLITIAFSGTATSGVLSVSAVNSCSASPTLTMNVSVNAVPNLAIFGNNAVCDNDNAAVLTATGAMSYTWNTGATTNSVSIAPTTATVYSVIASNNGCNATGQYSVSILSSPTIALTASSSSICPNETTTLTAIGNGNLFLWSDGFLGTTHTITSTSNVIYTVTSTYTNSCFAQKAVSISVKPTPTITVSGNAMACPGKTISLTASGANSYIWSSGVNSAINTFTPNGLQTLTVTGTSSVSNCTSVKTVTVNNYSAGTVSITGNPNLCSNVATPYTASGSVFYLWNNGATAATNTVLATGPTTLFVVSTTMDGCKDSASLALNVTQSPTITLSAVDSVCAGQSTTMFATINGATSYSWSTGATTTSITVAPISNGHYTLTANNGGCLVVKTHTIGVKSIPLINFAINPVICSTGQPLILNATPTGGNFTGVSVVGNVFNPAIHAGAYTITYLVTGSNGCMASSSQTINVTNCVGLEELADGNKISLYPNPMIDELTITSIDRMQMIEIFDFTGKLIIQHKIDSFEEKMTLTDLAVGLYHCRVRFENENLQTLRFVKR